MIQLTKKADYAIVVMAHLARFADLPTATAREVADATRLPSPMVAKILKILTRKGLLKSSQGIKGGYQLSRSASDITVAQVIEALEGPLAMTECTVGPPGICRTEHWCSVRPHWGVINQEIRQTLERLSLSTMVGPVHLPLISRETQSAWSKK